MKFLDFNLLDWYYDGDRKYAARHFAPAAVGQACVWIYNKGSNYDFWTIKLNYIVKCDEIFNKFHPEPYYLDECSLQELTKLVDKSLIKINKLKLFA